MDRYKFKIGDRVRITDERRESCPHYKDLLSTGVVIDIDSIFCGVRVHFNTSNHTEFFYYDSIEKVPLAPNTQLSFEFMNE